MGNRHRSGFAPRAARAVSLGLLPGFSYAQDIPDSSIRVQFEAAEVVDLRCSRRPFRMENTRATVEYFPYFSRNMFTSGLDLRPLVMGLFSSILLVPLTLAAVPIDLVAAPFRRDCVFSARIHGSLAQWAGGKVPGMELSAEASNLKRKGVEGIREPEIFSTRSAVLSDAEGRFSIPLSGEIGRYKALDIVWKVGGRPAGMARLSKQGGTFVLAEDEAGFGTGVYDNPSIVITPGKPGRPVAKDAE